MLGRTNAWTSGNSDNFFLQVFQRIVGVLASQFPNIPNHSSSGLCRSSRFVAVDLSIFVNLSYRLTFLHISLLYLCSWVDDICTVTRRFNGSPWIPRCLEALVLPSHFLTFEASKFPKVQEGAGLAERRHGCFTTFKNLSRSLTAKTRHRPCAKYSILPVHLLHQSNLPT